MPMKQTGPATDWEEIDRFDGGVGWIAHPDEEMQRASHALAVDGDVWLVDPVDFEGIDDLLAEYGDVAGVVVLLDRHRRDAAQIATRHDVSVWLPDVLGFDADDVDAPVQFFHRDLADTGYAVHEVFDNPVWHEVALYGEETGVLVVPEAVGTAAYFRADEEQLGVHPFVRIRPPRKLGRLNPSRILVGHGAGIHENAPTVLRTALRNARSGIPQLWWGIAKSFLPG
ncbi:hypothetical protein ACKVMT_06385 [Halobacteriales archaeon Cl-PHB]